MAKIYSHYLPKNKQSVSNSSTEISYKCSANISNGKKRSLLKLPISNGDEVFLYNLRSNL